MKKSRAKQSVLCTSVISTLWEAKAVRSQIQVMLGLLSETLFQIFFSLIQIFLFQFEDTDIPAIMIYLFSNCWISQTCCSGLQPAT